jgi:hypothetical protein
VWSLRLAGGIYYADHFTDAAIVQVCCGDHVCVKLFDPTIHRCGSILARTVQDLVFQKAIKPRQAKQFEEVLNATLADVPKPKKQFEPAHPDEIEKLVRAREGKNKE